MRNSRVLSLFALLAFLAGAAQGADATLKAKAKEVLEKNKEAIVSVKMVVTIRYVFGGREANKMENKMEVAGTVVDPSGLTVVSNTSIDPLGSMDFSMEGGGERMQIKPETSISDVKIVLSDGTEVPAEISLKDKDLDLAFIRPKEKAEKPCVFVTLTKTAEPQLLDEIITLRRAGRELNRAIELGLGVIETVVKKPRTFYACDLASGLTAKGCPMFSAQGELLGICVMRHNPVKGAGGLSMDVTSMLGQPVILPGEDIVEIAKQALTAKTEEAKTDKPEDKKTEDKF